MTPASSTAINTLDAAGLARGNRPAVIIGLGAIKRGVGIHWPRMRDGVHARLEHLLRSMLSPSDAFAVIDEENCLVVMPSLTGDEALAACLRVAYALQTAILGPCGFEDVPVSEAPDDGRIGAKPVPLPRLYRLARLGELDSVAIEGWARFELPRSGATEVLPLPAPHHFVPVWDAAREIVRAWRCVPLAVADPAHAAPQEISDRSLATLCLAADRLEHQLNQDKRFTVLVPVAYANLAATAGRMEYVAACRSLPAVVRPFVIFEVTGVPAGVTHAGLDNALSAIRPFARSLIAHIPVGAHPVASYERCGLRAIGLDLAAIADNDVKPEIARLAAIAKLLGVSTFVDGAADFGAVEAALENNIAWMSGPAIAAPVAVPQRMLRLEIESLACVLAGCSPDLSAVATAKARIERHLAAGRETRRRRLTPPGNVNPAREDDSRHPAPS